MTQDELQHLDAELAAGRISTEEYRARRDAVLARAQPTQSATAAENAEQQTQQQIPLPHAQQQQGQAQQRQPQQAQQQEQQARQDRPNPFPPAFSWDQTQPTKAQQQSQPANDQQPQGTDEPTQVVPDPAATTQSVKTGADSETTQIVPLNAGSGQQGSSNQPWGPQQGWSAADSTGTPWGGSDLPPAPEHGDASWMRQGPEVFDTASGSSRGKLIGGLSLVVVLAACVIVAVVFYASSTGQSAGPTPGGTAQHPSPPAPAPVPRLPKPPSAKPTPANPPEVLTAPPPGTPHPFNGLLDRPGLEGPRGGLLPPAVRGFALQAGMIDGWFHGTEGATPKTSLIAIRMPDQALASGLKNKYLEDQAGLAKANELSYQGVDVVSTGSGTYRTAYVSHNWAVIVDVSAGQPQNQQAKQLFTNTLGRQLAQTPPTVSR